jgi:hypothetical protein
MLSARPAFIRGPCRVISFLPSLREGIRKDLVRMRREMSTIENHGIYSEEKLLQNLVSISPSDAFKLHLWIDHIY